MITLDIEDDAINLLEVQGRTIKNAVSLFLEPGLIKDGVILNPDLVAQKIKGLLHENNIQEKTVIASVSGVHSIYRVARLPKISGDLMHEAIKHEMARLIPVPLEELHTSWQQIPVSSSENVIPMVGIPRETIDFTLSVLKQADLNSKYIDVRPLAIARVADEKDAIIINVHPFCFDIVLMVDGIPEIVRSLSFSESLVSPEEKVKEIKEELERTINFYNNSKPAKPVNEGFVVFISGQYKDVLLKAVTYPVRPLPVPFIPPDGFDMDKFVVNVGLALKAGKSGSFPLRVNINALPEVYLPKPVPVMSIVSWLFIVLGVALIALMVFNWQQALAQNTTIEGQVKKMTEQVAINTASKADTDALQAQIQKVKADSAALSAVLADLNRKRDTLSSELGEIISLMPGEITIGSITFAEGWTVTGSAKTSDIILSYAYSLKNSSKFHEMQLSSIAQTGFNQWGFTITLK